MHPVLESLPLAVVSGGQVQIKWAGLAWHWLNAKLNSTIRTKMSDQYCQECQAKPAHSKPAHYDIASKCQTTEIGPSGTCPCHVNSSNWYTCLQLTYYNILQYHIIVQKNGWYKLILLRNWQKADLRAFGGQVQLKKSKVGRLDDSGAGRKGRKVSAHSCPHGWRRLS